jgi:DNA-binding MarR family transcriptional regulator
MTRSADADTTLPRILRETFAALIRREDADLTSRQLAVFMICYVDEGPHSVSGLAARTRLTKAAVSRVLDRLGALGLTRRVADPRDKRSVLVAATPDGASFLRQLHGILDGAAEISAAMETDDDPERTGPAMQTTGTDGV